MRLVVFGLFHLLLSNFSSFVLHENLLGHVVASPFFLNYLPPLACFYYILLSLYSGVPMHSFFARSHFTEKQEKTGDCNEPALYTIMPFSTAQIKSLQGRNHSVSAAGSDGESSPQGDLEWWPYPPLELLDLHQYHQVFRERSC